MEKRDDFHIPEDIAEWVGLKKSEYLSKIIMDQKSDDLSFAEYPQYDSYIPGTIEDPDKVFKAKEDGQTLRIYLKTYSTNFLFHQVVIGIVFQDKESKSHVFIPIISFVTKSGDLAKDFCKGEVVQNHTLS